MLWQLRQFTPALACGERRKFGCVFAWQPRQVLSTSPGVSLLNRTILVTSPPPSTCACPGPWQLSQLAPAPPCSSASFAWGLSTMLSAFFWWHVAHVSLPTYPGAGVAAGAAVADVAVVPCFKAWVCACAAAIPAPHVVSTPTIAARRKYLVILRGNR